MHPSSSNPPRPNALPVTLCTECYISIPTHCCVLITLSVMMGGRIKMVVTYRVWGWRCIIDQSIDRCSKGNTGAKRSGFRGWGVYFRPVSSNFVSVCAQVFYTFYFRACMCVFMRLICIGVFRIFRICIGVFRIFRIGVYASRLLSLAPFDLCARLLSPLLSLAPFDLCARLLLSSSFLQMTAKKQKRERARETQVCACSCLRDWAVALSLSRERSRGGRIRGVEGRRWREVVCSSLCIQSISSASLQSRSPRTHARLLPAHLLASRLVRWAASKEAQASWPASAGLPRVAPLPPSCQPWVRTFTTSLQVDGWMV